MKKRILFLAAVFLCLPAIPVLALSVDELLQKGRDAQRMQKFSEAFQLYMAAAQKGSAEGQYHVAYCYFSGQGAKQDDQLARVWFLKAANQGDGRSERYLGNIYENGWGTAADRGAAKDWYQKAVQHGCKGAQADLDRVNASPSSPQPASAESPNNNSPEKTDITAETSQSAVSEKGGNGSAGLVSQGYNALNGNKISAGSKLLENAANSGN